MECSFGGSNFWVFLCTVQNTCIQNRVGKLATRRVVWKRNHAIHEKNKDAWEDFLKYRTNARIAYGAQGLVFIGALYLGIQMIASDGELTTGQGIVGLSTMGVGFGLRIGTKAAAKSNIEKAVQHYNDAFSSVPEESNKGLCWSIRGSSFSRGLSLVGTF